ncbi:MAG: 50S ribosomal protein L11 [Candidatus Margulisbacteria bacterium]|jgi:large subunit ribosomal protein L11|nr:50S ribosomal protein L11 [Candidatus Margulisiibacteriota bacterium]
MGEQKKSGRPGGPKQLTAVIKLQIEAGKANPAPPVGPALGQHGLNIMDFCKAYNDQTKDKAGQTIPVEISVFSDRTFTFKLKSPPASVLIRKALNIPKGSAVPNKNKVGRISRAKLLEIARQKMDGLNTYTPEEAVSVIAGTCRSMGVDVED